MALRESGRARDETYDLRGIVDPTVEIGVQNGDHLRGFADALLGADRAALDRARAALVAAMGPEALVSTCVLVGNFSKNDRIANALGIPLEAEFVKDSEDFRDDLGINDYKSAANSLSS